MIIPKRDVYSPSLRTLISAGTLRWTGSASASQCCRPPAEDIRMDAISTALQPGFRGCDGLFHAGQRAREASGAPLHRSLLKTLWRKGRRDVDVLRVEVDRGGFDLVLESDSVIRHVQLKSSRKGAKT